MIETITWFSFLVMLFYLLWFSSKLKKRLSCFLIGHDLNGQAIQVVDNYMFRYHRMVQLTICKRCKLVICE